MPAIVTDADVLGQIDVDDSHANAIDAAMSDLGTKAPRENRDAWAAWLVSYRDWATKSRDALSGGFVFGAWFGVPEMGNQALAYGRELAGWQAIVDALAKGQAPPGVAPAAVDPNAVATANAEVPGVNAPARGGVLAGPSAGTVILVGAGAAVALAFLLSRRL